MTTLDHATLEVTISFAIHVSFIFLLQLRKIRVGRSPAPRNQFGMH